MDTKPGSMNIVDMLLNDTAIMDDDDKAWNLPDDNFLDSLLKMEEHSQPFEFLPIDEDFMSSATTSPAYENAESSSCSDSGLSSVDHLPFVPKSELSDDTTTLQRMNMYGFSVDPLVEEEIIVKEEIPAKEEIIEEEEIIAKEEIIEEEEIIAKEEIIEKEEIIDDYENEKCNIKVVDKLSIKPPTVIKHPQPSPQLLKTTPRTVIISSPKQSNGQISITKPLPSKQVFIPINLSNIKTIKVINQNGQTFNADTIKRLQSINSGRRIFLRNNGTVVSKSMPILKSNKVVTSDSTSDESDTVYPRIRLTNEEKKLMEKEGIKLPMHYPLTKHQERDLKRIRRKIRNKISAQDSRKRKKEYVDGLEDKVKQCFDENNQLKKKMNALQTENERLKAALKRLQNSIAPGGTAPPSTCLLVILMSLALIAAPNLRPSVSDSKDVTSIDGQESNIDVTGRSRHLLCSKPESSLSSVSLKDMLNMVANGSSTDSQSDTIMAELGELLNFNGLIRNKDHDYSRSVKKDYYIPESDDTWTKATKRSAPSEWVDELLTSNAKNRRETDQVILLSSDEESY